MVSSKAFPLQNRAIAGQYPPGSVFKIVVAVAGLEEDLVDPEEEIVCRGSYTLGNHTYHCWKKHGHGKVDFHRAIVESCDVYFYKLGKKLGVDKIAEYATKFGLGIGTGFDLGNEKSGLIPTRRWKLKRIGIPWQTGETISTSIGQSFVLSTPIQAANLISATFNGGSLFSPQATLRVESTEGKSVFQFRPKLKNKVAVKPESLELVKQALIGVVNGPRGTGWRTKVSQLEVAGKTGTAQVVALEKEKALDEEGQLPDKFRDHAWFVAVAPADDPQIALAVLIENGGHGGSASAPVARELIKAYLKVEK
jgi:penicillin-binding protein 2